MTAADDVQVGGCVSSGLVLINPSCGVVPKNKQKINQAHTDDRAEPSTNETTASRRRTETHRKTKTLRGTQQAAEEAPRRGRARSAEAAAQRREAHSTRRPHALGSPLSNDRRSSAGGLCAPRRRERGASRERAAVKVIRARRESATPEEGTRGRELPPLPALLPLLRGVSARAPALFQPPPCAPACSFGPSRFSLFLPGYPCAAHAALLRPSTLRLQGLRASLLARRAAA